MDKHRKEFTHFAIAVILILFSWAVLLGLVYRSFSITLYKALLLSVIVATIVIILALIPVVFILHSLYKRRYLGGVSLKVAEVGVKVLMPLVISLRGLFGGDGDELRRFYVELNNILVSSKKREYSASRVLLLLPHCLQDSACKFKVTNDIGNCRNCGKCQIGEIRLMTEKWGIEARVITGGTLARSAVIEKKPDIILAVACERDMASGISDVKGIPVIGLINHRPNGPCYNTRVDTRLLGKKIEEIIGLGQE